MNNNNPSTNDIKLTPDNSNKKKVDSENVINISKTNDKNNFTIFTKENWPEIMNKLNDSSRGLKVQIFILIYKKLLIFINKLHLIYFSL